MESMTRSTHRKKLPKVVTSFPGGYDGVFSVPAGAQRVKPPGGVEDYGEIFGGGGRGSSIPVLDLSVVDETTENFRSSKVDYGTIFGGFKDDDLAVSYEELAVRGCGNNKWSSNNSKARKHSAKEFPSRGEDSCNLSGNSKQPPSEAPITSTDGMKQFNMSYLKTSQENKKQPNGTTHVAKLHTVPGFTYFVNEPPSKKKTESVTPTKGEVHRTWSFSGTVPDENNRNTEMLLPGKPNPVGLSGAKGGSGQVGSQSKDGSFNRSEMDLKSQSFSTAPTSNNFLESRGIRGHPRRSKSSNISSKVNPFKKPTSNGTDGSSDEEFDINSDAAACAAALKSVLEKAQESIRLAKEIRERGGKEGIQRFSNLSSEHSFKAKDKKKNVFDQENNSKKQHIKDRHKILGSELDESDERNSRSGSRIAGVSTASECGHAPLTSTEAVEENSRLKYAEVDGKSKHLLELVDTGTHIASTLAFHQVEMDKNTTILSMRKQETEASLSTEKQGNIIRETTTKETTEQIENNVEIEKSSEKDFGIGIAENDLHLGEQTKVSEVTTNVADSAPIKKDFRTTVGLKITEKDAQSEDLKCILDKLRHCEIKLSECLDMGEEKKSEASKTEDKHMSNEWQNMAKEEVPREDSQPVPSKLQYFYSCSQEEKENGLYSCNEGDKVHQEGCGIVTSDDVSEGCGRQSPERAHKDSLEGEALGTSNGLDSSHEGGLIQQDVCGFMARVDAPEICGSGSQKRTHKDSPEGEARAASNGLDSCNEVGIVQQEACGFVESDDASEICGSGIWERTHEDNQEGESCGVSNGLGNCNEKGMVEQEVCSFVASDDAPEVCASRNCGRTHKESREGEACGTSDVIQDIGVNDLDLISEHKGEEYPTVHYEELEKKVVVAPNEKKLVHVPREENFLKVLKDDHFEGEDQKISEEPYKHVKVDLNAFGGEYDWGDVEKRIKKGCIIEETERVWSEKYEISASNAVKLIQETEKTAGDDEENEHFDNNEQIGLQQKAAYEKNSDPDAHEGLRGVQEAHNAGVVEDHEVSRSTTGTSEDFYNCEWEGNSEEEVLEVSDFTKLDEKSDFVIEDRVNSSGTPGSSIAVESDENGTDPDEIGLSCEHKLPQENVLETTYFIQEAEEDIDVKLKEQDVSKDQKSTNVAFSPDRQGTITEKNVKEPEPSSNLESGGDFFYRFRENAERANEEFFEKEEDYVDPNVEHKVENKEKEIDDTKSSFAHQAIDTKASVEEMTTGQDIQFVRSRPQKNDLPEDIEARESSQKDLKEKKHSTRIEEMKRERARDKDRIAVERAIREARERAFAEAREKAERAAVARAGAEVRQRMMAEAREKLEKASAEAKIADKASIEAKQRAERAAVERATAEARERALEKALSQKTTSQGRVQTDGLHGSPKDSALKHSLSSSDLERDGNNSESAQRRKARTERHERIMERAAQALAEKNMRDLQAQKEQAEINRLAESLDADVKRWAKGKEKNLRALLSTLQYILGPDSGWQPISLTETITSAAVKKAYRKATLYVHPDKLQQRGASIQQKYTCEKVFDLLKAAWNKFNSEER